jgi:Cd2+/Zn2+-exporting ATPase
MIKKVIMKNLICSSCAAKIEKALGELNHIESASFNFPNQVMLLEVTDEYNEKEALPKITQIVDSIEDGVETYPYEKRHVMETKKSIETYYSVFIGLAIYAVAYLFERYEIPWGFIPLYWIGYFFISFKIARKTLKGIQRKDYFNENTLMFIATIAAMFLMKYFESIMVIIFYTLGEYLQHRAVHKSKQEVSSLIDLRVEYAHVYEDGKLVIKDPMSIRKNDIVVVKTGEKIPIDGHIIKGSTSLNTSALTGEAKLSHVGMGDYVLSGNLNVGNVIEVKAKKEYKESTLAKIIDLIENSTNHKAKTETFITKFAKVYTPIVTVAALLMFIIPTIFDSANYQEYIYRAATFLVISCPCALVLSIPLSYFSGIGASAKNGILVKGSSYLHMMTNVDAIGIDKTGTLTHGTFKVDEYTNEEVLKIAASLEHFSNHPIAKSIVDYYQGDYYEMKDVEEIAGLGLKAKLNGETILVGNSKLLNKHKIKIKDKKVIVASNVLVSKGNQYLGRVIIRDQLKDSSLNVIRRLNRKHSITMLTGDNDAIASDVASSLGGIDFESSLLPEDKITAFNNIKSNKLKMYVGDGINDAPLLKNADIGVAMGSGSEIAIDVADVIIMDDDLSILEKAFKIASKTKRIAYENIVLSLGVKFSFLALAAVGISSMLMAIFADVGITLIAVMNSLRIIYERKGK